MSPKPLSGDNISVQVVVSSGKQFQTFLQIMIKRGINAMLRTLDFYIIKTAQHIEGGVFLFASLYPKMVAHAMKCTAHSMADTQRLWAMSLRSILHVSRYDQLSAIQFLAPLLARSYFLLFLFIERLYSLTVSPCRLLICASASVKQEWFTMQPSHSSLPQSLTSHFSLHSSICGWCLV